jgi:hypothetical protein
MSLYRYSVRRTKGGEKDDMLSIGFGLEQILPSSLISKHYGFRQGKYNEYLGEFSISRQNEANCSLRFPYWIIFIFCNTEQDGDGQEHKDGEEIIIDEGDGDEDIEIRDIENGDKEIYIRIMDRYFCVIYWRRIEHCNLQCTSYLQFAYCHRNCLLSLNGNGDVDKIKSHGPRYIPNVCYLPFQRHTLRDRRHCTTACPTCWAMGTNELK